LYGGAVACATERCLKGPRPVHSACQSADETAPRGGACTTSSRRCSSLGKDGRAPVASAKRPRCCGMWTAGYAIVSAASHGNTGRCPGDGRRNGSSGGGTHSWRTRPRGVAKVHGLSARPQGDGSHWTTASLIRWASSDCLHLTACHHIEPPWYGPVGLVVWEGGVARLLPIPIRQQSSSCSTAVKSMILRIPLCSMSPEFFNLLKRGHENAS